MDITQEIIRELLNYDTETGELVWKRRARKWFKDERSWKIWNTRYEGNVALASLDNQGYFHGTLFGTTYLAHRVIWLYMTGEWPEHQIDHIDGERANNKWENLRQATDAENRRNQKKRSNNTSGVMGVYWNRDRGKWQAQIAHKGKLRGLGRFDNFEEAVSVRKTAEIEYGYHKNHGR